MREAHVGDEVQEEEHVGHVALRDQRELFFFLIFIFGSDIFFLGLMWGGRFGETGLGLGLGLVQRRG